MKIDSKNTRHTVRQIVLGALSVVTAIALVGCAGEPSGPDTNEPESSADALQGPNTSPPPTSEPPRPEPPRTCGPQGGMPCGSTQPTEPPPFHICGPQGARCP
jgi:hypothetical protein